MRGWLAAGAGAALLVAALAIEAPATLLDGRVAALTDGRVRIAAASGRLWRGSGELTLLPDGSRVPVSWRLDPLPLLRGEISGTLTAADANRPASFVVDSDRFSVHGFTIALPAAAVLHAAGVPAALAIAEGTFVLDIADFARRGDHLDARAELRWQNATLPDMALGEVRIAAAGSGTEIPATLSNRGGEVDLSGSMMFSIRRTPQIDARITPRAGLPAERNKAIAAALSTIGRADGTGGYRIVWPLTVR
jgi:general secretion pathway protein N